ncbi:MAG: mechanosensitive ion channel family protein [Candidatus Paracaedibacteraceae bacterium]|nr:mechanosensitive ion channel family protein [Candidatus Paracaedibacteraceae bacterium]
MLQHLLTKEFFHTYFHYFVGAGIIILGFIVASIVVSILAGLLSHKAATPEDKAKNRALISKISFPVNLVFLVLAIYVVHKLGDFPKEFDPYLERIVKAVLDIAFFMSLYYFAGAVVITRLFAGLGINVNATIKDLLADIVKAIVAVLGVVTVLGNFNINIGPVLGGLTVLTSAVALAAKDSIQGLFGSLTVALEGKFKEGDWIKLGDLQGFVENIGIRTTSVRGFDRTLTVVPNDAFITGSVTNFTRINNWEINVQVPISYKATPRQLESIVMRYRDWLGNNPDIESDPQKAIMAVRINDLTDRGFNLFLFFYTKTNQWLEYMRVREQCMMQLVKIIEEEGTAIAYPTQSVFLDNASVPSGKKPSPSGTTVMAEAPKKATIAKAPAAKPKK